MGCDAGLALTQVVALGDCGAFGLDATFRGVLGCRWVVAGGLRGRVLVGG